jgi:hypothetical protein
MANVRNIVTNLNGNVIINSESDNGARLQVTGSGTISGDWSASGYVFANGESLGASIRVGGIYGDLGLYVPSTYDMQFDLGWNGSFKFTRANVDRFRIDSSGVLYNNSGYLAYGDGTFTNLYAPDANGGITMGDATAPVNVYYNDTHTFQSAGQLANYGGFTSTGFGVGTVAPSSKLEVVKQGNASGGTMLLSGSKTNNAVKYGIIATSQYASDTETEGVGLIGGVNTSTENIVVVGGGIDEINTATSIRFYAAANTTTRGSANERMRINAANDAGNVYIGTTSTNDYGRLIVNGFSGAWLPYIADTSLSYNQYGIVVGSANTGNTNIGGGLTLVNNNASVGAYGPVVSWSSMTAGGAYNSTYAFITGVYGGQGGDTNWAIGDLIFGTAVSYGASERMRIRYNGNVLIGTTTDNGYTLNVNGSLYTSGQVMLVGATNTIIKNHSNYPWFEGQSASAQIFFGRSGANPWGIGSDSTYAFRLWDSSFGSTYFNITTGGNVGIGITNPTVKLDVNGPGRFVSDVASRVLYLKQDANNSGNIIQFQNESGTNTWEVVGRNNQFYFYNANLANFPIYIHPATSNVSMSSSTDIGDKLFVNGTIAAVGGITIRESGSGILSLVRQNSGFSARTYYYENANLYWDVGMIGGSYSWRVNDPNFGVNNKLVVSQGFDWGVGIGTDSPTRRLHIVGTTRHERVYAYANNVFQFANDVAQNELWLHLGTQGAFTTDKIYYRVNTNTSEEEGEIIVKNTCATANIEWLRNSYNVMVTAVKARMQGSCGACEIFIKVRYGSNYGGANTTVQWQVHNGTDSGFTTVNAVATPGTGTSEANIASTDGYMVSTSNNQSVGGNLGVGTTAPNYRVQVETTTGTLASFDNGDGAIWSTLTSAKSIGLSSGTNYAGSSDFTWLKLTGGSSGNIIFSVNNEVMRMLRNGNVLIGTTTDAGYKLDVNGSGRIAGQFIQGSGAARSTNGTTVALTYNTAYSANSDLADGGRFLSIVNESTVTNAYSALSFRVNPDNAGGGSNAMVDMKFVNANSSNSSTLIWTFLSGGAWADRMALTSAGNVGIGTTSPTLGLHVADGKGFIVGPSGASGSMYVSPQDENTVNGGYGIAEDTADIWLNYRGYQDGFSYFRDTRIGNGKGTAIVMVDGSAGHVGIGTTSPAYKLDVVGDTRITSGSLGVGVAPNATDGRIDASNDIVAYQTSDQRLKENVTPIENALEKVKSLTGVEFDWIEEHKHIHGYEGHDTGIIAQQVQAVMPTAVRTNDTGYLSVRYEKLIGILIEANKELAARVEELEKKLK